MMRPMRTKIAHGLVVFTLICVIGIGIFSDRIILRQINANLTEISEQLKLLRQMPPSETRVRAGPASERFSEFWLARARDLSGSNFHSGSTLF